MDPRIPPVLLEPLAPMSFVQLRFRLACNSYIVLSLTPVLQVCKKTGHQAGFVGSVYMDCPNKPCYLCKLPGKPLTLESFLWVKCCGLCVMLSHFQSGNW